MSTKLLRAIGWDLVSGQPTGLPHTLRKALGALEGEGVRYAITGAIALGLRGHVRTTLDLDVVVLADEVPAALGALRGAGLEAPDFEEEEVDPQYVVTDPENGVTVDLLVGFGEPEVSLIGEATRQEVAGVEARVARPEHLLISYLYSNQPRHLGDFAALVQGGQVELGRARELLADMHPEMVPLLERRWAEAAHPAPPPPRPGPRREGGGSEPRAEPERRG